VPVGVADRVVGLGADRAIRCLELGAVIDLREGDINVVAAGGAVQRRFGATGASVVVGVSPGVGREGDRGGCGGEVAGPVSGAAGGCASLP
jgi:hypothetical protein